MSQFNIDLQGIVITAIVSLVMTITIVFLVMIMQPGLIVSMTGTGLFIYIGVFAAIRIMDTIFQPSKKNQN